MQSRRRKRGRKASCYPGTFRHGLHLRGSVFTFALQNAANDALAQITATTKGKNIAVLLGMPVPFFGSLYNCAVLVRGGKIIGAVPKSTLQIITSFMKTLVCLRL